RDDEAWRLYVQADLPTIDLTQFVNDPVRLWENDGSGVFTDIGGAAGIADVGLGQGVVAFDYDGDGDLDLLLTHDPEPPVLLRNDGGNANHWIGIALDGVRSSRNGVGGLVTLVPSKGGRPLTREVSASSTYLAQDGTGIVRFGLGSNGARVKGITIRWPSGRVQTVKRLTADTVHRVTEATSC